MNPRLDPASPFWVLDDPGSDYRKVADSLRVIRRDPARQLDWLIDRLATAGQVTTADIRAEVLAVAARASKAHRKIKVRAHTRKV